jgi:two-component system LytT family response regulator
LQSNFRAGETIQRVQAAARQLGAQRNRFLIETGERLLSLNVEEIAYFYTRENNVYAVTLQGQRYPIRLKMEQLEQELSEEQFFRANRQYLVQIKAVKVAHLHFNGKLKLELIPQAADEVLVSREKATSFKQWMGS